jgi:lysozyme
LGRSCNETEAECWLAQDIDYAERIVQLKVDVPLNENQFSAIVSFVFNVGASNFISSTLLKLLNEGLYDKVPEQMKRWKYGRDKGGNKIELTGLLRRRQAEAELWSTPA